MVLYDLIELNANDLINSGDNKHLKIVIKT